MINIENRFLIIGTLLVFCGIEDLAAKDLYNFFVSRLACDSSDPRIVHNYSCSTHTINRKVKAHDILIFCQPNVKLNELYVLVNYLHRVSNTYRRSVISMEESFCGFLAGTSKSYLTRMLWPALKKSSNLEDKCPYYGILNISGLVFEDSFLPPALPEGQARIDIHVRDGPQRLSLIKAKFYIEIKPKGAVKLDF